MADAILRLEWARFEGDLGGLAADVLDYGQPRLVEGARNALVLRLVEHLVHVAAFW